MIWVLSPILNSYSQNYALRVPGHKMSIVIPYHIYYHRKVFILLGGSRIFFVTDVIIVTCVAKCTIDIMTRPIATGIQLRNYSLSSLAIS